jgi:hypothetical protein
MVAGTFELIEGAGDSPDDFDLRPLASASAIPEDQQKVCRDAYEVRNILKLLKAHGVFTQDNISYDEFIARIRQAARAGCIIPNATPGLATSALEQIRTDVVRRKGRTIVYRHLRVLAKCGWPGAIVAVLLILGGQFWLPELGGYGWVILGGMVGAWALRAASGQQVSFGGIQDYLDFRYEPYIRMAFVAVVAAIFALFLRLGILSLKIGDIDLGGFAGNVGLAFALGAIAGISEKQLTVHVIDRARQAVAAGAP